MLDLSGTNLVLTFLTTIAIAWLIISWALRPVVKLNFSAYELITEYGNQRITEKKPIDEGGVIDLRSGMNQVYLVVKNGIAYQYPPGTAYLLNPILRSSEDIVFFCVNIRVVGNRVVKFDATNLSKSNVRLVWNKM